MSVAANTPQTKGTANRQAPGERQTLEKSARSRANTPRELRQAAGRPAVVVMRAGGIALYTGAFAVRDDGRR